MVLSFISLVQRNTRVDRNQVANQKSNLVINRPQNSLVFPPRRVSTKWCDSTIDRIKVHSNVEVKTVNKSKKNLDILSITRIIVFIGENNKSKRFRRTTGVRPRISLFLNRPHYRGPIAICDRPGFGVREPKIRNTLLQIGRVHFGSGPLTSVIFVSVYCIMFSGWTKSTRGDTLLKRTRCDCDCASYGSENEGRVYYKWRINRVINASEAAGRLYVPRTRERRVFEFPAHVQYTCYNIIYYHCTRNGME